MRRYTYEAGLPLLLPGEGARGCYAGTCREELERSSLAGERRRLAVCVGLGFHFYPVRPVQLLAGSAKQENML